MKVCICIALSLQSTSAPQGPNHVFVPPACPSDSNCSLLLLTFVTGGDVNSSYTLGHSMNCFLVMIWSRKFAGTRVRKGPTATSSEAMR